MPAKDHLENHPIPDGFQIYEPHLSVAGVGFRREIAADFCRWKNQWIEFERDTNNQYDENAIKVIGCNKGWFVSRRRFIGFVPKEVASKIQRSGCWGKIRPRLIRTYIGKTGFVEILFQILGPVGEKTNYINS